MDQEILEEFLVKAKVNTYASSGEGGERILEDGSKELTYEEGDFKYRDRYFGYNPFIGEEIVWKDGKMIWAMNYYGRITSNFPPAKEIYSFLRKALRQASEIDIFRGPSSFYENEFKYTNASEGNIENFIGTEKIFYIKDEVYELIYHGGLIKEKPRNQKEQKTFFERRRDGKIQAQFYQKKWCRKN